MWFGKHGLVNVVWQTWFGKCGLANVVWQTWFGKSGLVNMVWQTLLGRVFLAGGGSGGWGVSMSLMSSISQVYGFLDLWSQQQHQLHESIVNRLTYGCKPVKTALYLNNFLHLILFEVNSGSIFLQGYSKSLQLYSKGFTIKHCKLFE